MFTRKLATCLVILAFLCIGPVTMAGFASSDTTVSWGLKPNTTEQTPDVGERGAKLLQANNGIFVGDTTKKEVYLTFDLGYEAGYTDEVLDVLKENNVKAIFFLCGNYLKEEELVNRMITDGHAIGNHTNHHKDLPKLGAKAMRADITQFDEKFKEKYGAAYNKPLRHFRPPSGRFNEAVLKEANAQGLRTLMWSIAIVDWNKKPIDAAKSANKVTSRVHPGAIMLFHIANSGMPEMLKLLIPQLKEKGYTIGDATTL